MNLGENIFYAFDVVNKTHENVDKLMKFCRLMAEEKREFDLMSPKFLRYKSDSDYWGWNVGQMFLLFQDTQDELLENGWRDGPVYVLEILLYDSDTCEPWLGMAKFEYADIKGLPVSVSSASYYYFTHPLYDVDYDELGDDVLVAEMPEEIMRKYWGVKRVVCKYLPLVEVDYKNAYEKIFGTFKILRDK